MTLAKPSRAIPLGVAAALAVAPNCVRAQGIQIRFYGVDMYGGVVLPEDSELGVAFGTRVDLVTLFNPNLHMGLRMDWWAADRESGGVDVRDIVFGLDVWRLLSSAGWVRPYLGLAADLHVVDASAKAGPPLAGTTPAEADELDGHRIGAAGFSGLAIQATGTGAIWVELEYRYSVVSDFSNHAFRVGARLAIAKM